MTPAITFKNMSDIAKNELAPNKSAVMCEYILGPWGEIKKEPFNSLEYKCEFCGGVQFNTCMFEGKKIWQCSKIDCAVQTVLKLSIGTTTQPSFSKGLEWPLFCEMNGLGDLNYGIKFELIEQSLGKIDYLKKFVANPRGIIIMQGTKGSGKTYATLGACELYTRTSDTIIFLTQKQLNEKWFESIKSNCLNNFISKITNVPFLAIDDFGTGAMSSDFLTFFMDLINTRMQWSNRGTIITTNLKGADLTKYCGDALSDRLNTGQIFEFYESSRRKKNVL